MAQAQSNELCGIVKLYIWNNLRYFQDNFKNKNLNEIVKAILVDPISLEHYSEVFSAALAIAKTPILSDFKKKLGNTFSSSMLLEFLEL